MLARRHGRIISLASVSGERGAQFASAPYAVSKAGVIMITRMFALHAADSGVSGQRGLARYHRHRHDRAPGHPVDPRDVPMNRMGTPEEVAQAVVFLASDVAVLHHRPDARRQRRTVHEIAEAP